MHQMGDFQHPKRSNRRADVETAGRGSGRRQSVPVMKKIARNRNSGTDALATVLIVLLCSSVSALAQASGSQPATGQTQPSQAQQSQDVPDAPSAVRPPSANPNPVPPPRPAPAEEAKPKTVERNPW